VVHVNEPVHKHAAHVLGQFALSLDVAMASDVELLSCPHVVHDIRHEFGHIVGVRLGLSVHPRKITQDLLFYPLLVELEFVFRSN